MLTLHMLLDEVMPTCVARTDTHSDTSCFIHHAVARFLDGHADNSITRLQMPCHWEESTSMTLQHEQGRCHHTEAMSVMLQLHNMRLTS